MSWTSRAWLVGASIGAVEALKDEGFCRWNYAMRQAKNSLRSYTQSKRLPGAPSSTIICKKTKEDQKLKKSEESLRMVMYLSCWGPN